MSGVTTVGAIQGFLRLDATDWSRTLATAQAQAEALGSADPNVDIRTNATEAIGRLAAVQAEVEHLDNDDATVDVRANTAAAESGVQRVANRVQSLAQAQSALERAQERSTQSSNALRAAEASLSAVQQRHALVGQQLAQAEQRLSELRAAEAPDADAIQAAEQRVAQARQRSASAAASLIGAENRVTNARSAAARAASAASQAEEDMSHSSGDLDRHQQLAHKSTMSLIGALSLVAPAAVPIAGAVAGLGAAFGGLGAAGVLAILGIKNAIKQGTDAGKEFQGGLDKLQGNLNTLEATAATGVMKPFLAVVDNLQPKMPGINNSVSSLAGTLGRVMVPAADGVETAFLGLMPLMTDLAEYAVKGANAFDQWAHSDGLQRFGGYATAVLPGVLHDIGQLVELAGKVAGSFAGWGGGVLSILGTLADLLNSLPTGVLTVLANGGLAVYGAFKTFKLLQSLVSGFGDALGGLAGNMQRLGATRAASSLQGVARGMQAVSSSGSIANLAVGGLAAVLGIAMFAWSLYKQKQAEARAEQEAMTQAIQADNGALGEQWRQLISQKLAASDVVPVLQRYGIAQKDIMAAVANQPAAWDRVNAKLKDNATQSQAAAGAAGGLGKSVKGIAPDAAEALATLKKFHDEVSTGKSKVAQEAAYQKALASATGMTTKKLSDAQVAQLGMATETSNSTAKVKAQNQAIQDLTARIDAEIAKNYELQGGLTGIGAARQSMIQELKKQTSSTSLNTAAGIANRQSIEQVVGQLQSYRDTQIKNHVSNAKATADYKSQAASILDTIRRLDGAKSSTYKYAQQLLKVPSKVNTQIHVSAPGASSILATIRAIVRAADGANVGISNLNRHGRGLPAYASGTDNAPGGLAIVGEAGAELVLGPSLRLLTPGSQVLNAQDTSRVLSAGAPTVTTTTAAAPAAAGPSPTYINIERLEVAGLETTAQVEDFVSKLDLAILQRVGVRA